MSKYLKYIMIALIGFSMTACANKTYSIKKEGNKTVKKVPAWYMADIAESKACDKKRFGKTKNKECIYGVGTAVSPSLELAIDKAKMIAKAEMADIIKGEMNKKIKIFVSELGNTQNKTIVNDVESALVNHIKETPVRGYEVFAQEVTMTTNGYYRAWIGLRLPLGEFNKMYNYNIATVVDAYKLKELAEKAYKDVEVEVVTQ
tara:strand:+ start:758 stop:1366 length:609 start_codon:yes stop_codon:yes gene_type:complete